MSMQKQKNFQVAIIGVLAFAVLFMSVGFAAYSQQLNINGTAVVAANKWSVHFKKDSIQKVQDSVEAESAVIDESTTSATFKAKLEKPGDFYAFSVDVINDGTFDAALTSVTMSNLTTAQQKYLKYTVSYDNSETWTGTTSGLNYALNKNQSKNVIVRVEYIAPDSAADLPEEDTTVSLTLTLNYGQI